MAPILDLYSTKGHGKLEQIAFSNGNAYWSKQKSKK